MAEQSDFGARKHLHISFDVFRVGIAYSYPRRKIDPKPLRDDYAAHSKDLLDQLTAALGDIPVAGQDTRLPVEGLKAGAVVEVGTAPPPQGSRAQAVKLPKGLEFPAQDVVVLRSERRDDRTESALLFVPDDARTSLKGRISSYGQPQGNQLRPDVDRFEKIETIRAADANSLFVGNVDFVSVEPLWWELWVRHDGKIAEGVAAAARLAALEVHEDRLLFPDTTVLFVHASAEGIAGFVGRIPGAVTEIRKAIGTIEPFLDRGAKGIGPHDWTANLAKRIDPPPQNANAVCVLDTGIAAQHPLIAPALHGAWAYDAAWGADDHYPNGGHGTPLAGLALYGDLEPLMNDARQVQLTHAIESMKLLPPRGFPKTRPPSYGVVTEGAVALVEAERPNVRRAFCLANSACDFPPERPSSWSGALDQIASGSMPGDQADGVPAAERPKRLMVVATGNMPGGKLDHVRLSHPLEDPSQSWNSLSIGGFTRKETPPTNPPGLKPVVPANHRSPFSLGSQALSPDLTPIKPEVLFEAGNMIADPSGDCGWEPSVSLLAPGSSVMHEPLVPFWATSAAAGMAGHFIGTLQAALPDLWPETHRALTVDSAHWPEPIRKRLIGTGQHWKTGNKAAKQAILREVGYGVPDLQRAISSAGNDVTLIAQAPIQPFVIGESGGPVFNEMHVYDLPWPKGVLEKIENGIVTMKVTLSYFIEPNLSGRAATRPETYRSFGLRFAMKRRLETKEQFKRRVSGRQEKDEAVSQQEGKYWLVGPAAVQAGSLHCDLWRGKAIDLSSHDAIGVYPVTGWWKTHPGQKRFNDKGRYALVISISAPDYAVDMHSEISAIVAAKIAASVTL
ncbi:S8 family peptidase [Paracoccus tibetensis]|uniref:Subtilase family protein n=1 Tax=Paracoccus tibetensis TaxID=336292 RepID=A0A1G5JF90_9RHOB|nr:S8 family peptidase [Paracoccus tibetensis]SCY87025.1 Subtilase family protein [Paracoccus tibetensis]